MITKKIFLTLTISALSLLTYTVYGQEKREGKKDTTESISKDELKEQQLADKERINEAKDAKKQTKADAKVTKQENRDAMTASRESKKAYKDEKKAQKSRKMATKQSEKAADAREKSERN